MLNLLFMYNLLLHCMLDDHLFIVFTKCIKSIMFKKLSNPVDLLRSLLSKASFYEKYAYNILSLF